MHVEAPSGRRTVHGLEPTGLHSCKCWTRTCQDLQATGRRDSMASAGRCWLMLINRSALAAHYDRHQHTADLVPVGRGSVSAIQS
jgi:hypothetical protein